MGLKQSMQVSMKILRAATTHGEGQWRFITPYMYINTYRRQQKRGEEEAKVLNRHERQSRQTADSQTAGKKTRKPCKAL